LYRLGKCRWKRSFETSKAFTTPVVSSFPELTPGGSGGVAMHLVAMLKVKRSRIIAEALPHFVPEKAIENRIAMLLSRFVKTVSLKIIMIRMIIKQPR
jgi:hypothetical protein